MMLLYASVCCRVNCDSPSNFKLCTFVALVAGLHVLEPIDCTVGFQQHTARLLSTKASVAQEPMILSCRQLPGLATMVYLFWDQR